jgi:hypothetical protein
VTELKTLLQKHELPQTGKKEDLVQRALENKLSPEEEEEELVSFLKPDIWDIKLIYRLTPMPS